MSFLHMTGLGKMVKEAYKVNLLKVGAFQDHSVIVTPHCAFAVKENNEPNKMKAIITEYLGYVPVYDPTSSDAGFVEAGKANGINELDGEEVKNINDLLFKPKSEQPFTLTPLYVTDYGHLVRVIQNPVTLECLGIRDEHLDLISAAELDYDIEGDPVGPTVDQTTRIAYFKNATTIMTVKLFNFSSEKIKEILQTLQLIELREEA